MIVRSLRCALALLLAAQLASAAGADAPARTESDEADLSLRARG